MAEERLWAPWRLEYIKGPKGGECIFCVGPDSGDDRAKYVVRRGEHCFAILNKYLHGVVEPFHRDAGAVRARFAAPVHQRPAVVRLLAAGPLPTYRSGCGRTTLRTRLLGGA